MELADNVEVEVVMIKKMTVAEYNKMRSQAREKGWDIKAYQIGYYGKKE